jgi:16S rRNA (cytosine1402-N4)-methyltransferase
MTTASLQHTTVLLDEAVDALITDTDATYIDATFGRGGHSKLILSKLNPNGRLVIFDKDPAAIAAAEAIGDTRLSIRHEGFKYVGDLPHQSAAGLLMDLGVSSPQIDTPERGFSFRFDAPLDMRMDTTRGQTVAQWLLTADVTQITEVIRDYGEERFASSIAKAIVTRREEGHPISSWLTRSKLASRARTQQRAHFRLFGFSSMPSLKSCSKR